MGDGIDIPVEAFIQRWRDQGVYQEPPLTDKKRSSKSKTAKKKSADRGNAEKPENGDWSTYRDRQSRRQKTATTKKANKNKRNAALKVSSDPDDLRHGDQVRATLNKSLEELRQQQEKEKARKP